MNKKIVITGGGTGGHVFPALAIADEMKRRGYTVLYVGTSHGMEAKLVPEKGYPFYTVKTGSVKNQGVGKVLKTSFQLFFAIVWALRFLLKEKPAAVLGVGGYVSVPLCVAAFVLRVPLFLQEQNSSVGIANRFLGKLATRIFLGFESARPSFPEGKCFVTGNPLRASFYEKDFPKHDPHGKNLLVMGGSQGAKAINDAMTSLLGELEKNFPGIQIVHQTGQKDFPVVLKEYEKSFTGKYDVRPFLTDMPAPYRNASLVIARSGALTVSELLQVGRPALFVPYPRQGQNDQTSNAYLLEKMGVARVVEQGENFRERFWKTLQETFQPAQLEKMGQSASKLQSQHAPASIGDLVEESLQATRF